MRGLLHLVEVRLACVISAGELLKQRVVLEDRDQAVKLVALLCVPPSRTITHQPPRTFFFRSADCRASPSFEHCNRFDALLFLAMNF